MSVRISRLFVTLLVAVFCAGLYAQSQGDVLTVHFSQDVVVGDKILPAGPWDIRWDGAKENPTLKLYRDDAMNVEVPVRFVPSEDNRKRTATEAVIAKIGPDYYLTNIWIEGERTGYAIPLPPQTATLQHGDMQRIPAKFVSGSRFSQGAWMEGQARSHVAQGLGNPEDQYLTGIVVARSFSPALAQSDALVENRPSDLPAPPDDRALAPATLNEERSDIAAAPIALAEPQESPVAPKDQEVALPARKDEPELQARVEPVEIAPAPPAQQENTRSSESAALSNGDAVSSSPAQPEAEVAELIPAEPLAEPPYTDSEGQNPADRPTELPATASNWPTSVLIGCALAGLALMVRRS